ncbi:fe(2+) transport protein 1-like [Wolffia australiana]
MGRAKLFFAVILFFSLAISMATAQEKSNECARESTNGCYNKPEALKLKIIAIFVILAASTAGIALPLFSNVLPALAPDKKLFVVVKAFASSVILSTGFMHVLPDSINSLQSKCLSSSVWREFPFLTFIAMVSSVGTLMMESLWMAVRAVSVKAMNSFDSSTVIFAASSLALGVPFSPCVDDSPRFGITTDPWNQKALIPLLSTQALKERSAVQHQRQQAKVDPIEGEELSSAAPGTLVHVHGHDHFLAVLPASKDEVLDGTLRRYRVIAQVLEMGIVVHSIVIGLSMGASQSPCTIRPLVAALCFHQFFEGMGLGGCLVQAEYKTRMKLIMVFFFSVTTPLGVALGIGLSNIYSDNSPTALIVIGILNACSSGLLIYMALVDLLAADFMGSRLQASINLQGWGYLAVLLGMAGMSVMAKWA